MAYCRNCGQRVSMNDDFCKRCGRPLNGGGGDTGYSSQQRDTTRSENDWEWKICKFCDGTGKHPGDGNILPPNICPVCEGSREVKVWKNSGPCRGECKGAGKIDISGGFPPANFRRCRGGCRGTGWERPY